MRIVGRSSSNHSSRRQLPCAALRAVALVSTLAPPADAIVRRRLNVNSNPQGALVYVDNQQIGTTPCSVDFTYYGTREIRLIKPGFETLTVNQPIPAPWYQYTPIDFFAENLVATKIRDNRTVNYNLAPQLIVPTPELLERANQLRRDTLQYGAPAGPALPINAGPAPVVVPGPVTTQPSVTLPEPLPGINPPPTGLPIFQQPAPPQAPAGAPLLPPRPY